MAWKTRLGMRRPVGWRLVADVLFAVAWAQSAGAQTVQPPSIGFTTDSPVCSAGSIVQEACIQLPRGTIADKVDVFLLLDDTGSFEATWPNVAGVFSELVADLETALPGVSLAFGVGRFEDYGGPGDGFSSDALEGRPFILNQPLVTAADSGGAAQRDTLVEEALARTGLGDGGDGPETALEALYQVATGLGFDGDGDGSTAGVEGQQPAGSAAAQTAADSSGDVPAFATLGSGIPRSGSIGGAGFRDGSLRLVIVATDICSVAAFDLVDEGAIPSVVTGSGDEEPTTAFACESTDPGTERFGYVGDAASSDDNTISGAVAPRGAATLPATVAALNAAGIRVLGLVDGLPEPALGPLVPSAAASTDFAGPDFEPAVFLSALARLTGAVDDTGQALVFDIGTSGSQIKDAIVAAVTATATRPVDVSLATAGAVPPGLTVGIDPTTVLGVAPESRACFELTLGGTGLPDGEFTLDFADAASGAVLGTIPVAVRCTTTTTTSTVVASTTTSTSSTVTTSSTTTTTPSICGDGAVDAARGEQCDVGTANGRAASCCDASCRIVPASTVCRQAAVACDADAVCNGVDPVCPANLRKAEGETCDDGDPTTTAACRNDVCEGVEVAVDVPATIDVPANAKTVGIPVAIDVTGDGAGKARVVMQGSVSCAELTPVPVDCATKRCKFLRRQLAARCGSQGAGAALASGLRPGPGRIAVTGTFTRQFGQRTSEAKGELRLNKLGRELLLQGRALPLQTKAVVRDRRGTELSTLIRTLLRLR